ncbi:MAG: tetratricopeptide repeat protein [Bacteroidetes bacterium]|nr:tetratricopeptide repeat protein [Bacteroidota bacterium]
MARARETAAPSISNDEIIAEINLIEQIQQIESRLAYDPRSIRFAQLADAYLGIGNFDTAIGLCEKGLENHPHYDTASLVLAKAYYLSGNKPRAKQVLEDFLQSHPSSLPAHKMLGDLALDEDDVIGTVNHYRIALRFDPINRQIIQTLVDLKDQYQKLKQAKSGDEEEEEAAPVLKSKSPAKTVAAKPKPTTKSVVPDDGLDAKVTDDLLLKEEEEFRSSLETTQPPSRPPTLASRKSDADVAENTTAKVAQPAVVPAATGPLPHGAAMVNKAGILYFYDDDEVSFEEYKLRLQMQKEGKAIIMDRAELDQLIAQRVKPPEDKTAELPKEPDVTEPVLDKEDVPEKAVSSGLPDEVQEFERAETAAAEDTPLSPEEQEAALEELEMSYHDYLDTLTEEDDLLEALFDQSEEEDAKPVKEVSLLERLTGIGSDAPEENSISYADYLNDITDELEREEASFDDGGLISLDQFSSFLDESSELIDFATFALLASRNGEGIDLFEEADTIEEGPAISYGKYVETLSSDEKSEAGVSLIQKAEETVDVEETVVAEAVEETAVAEAKVVPIETKQPEVKTEPLKEEMIPEEETVSEEQPVVETLTEREKPAPTETPKPVLSQAEEEEQEADEEIEEDYTEEEINPQDASPELVEKFASRGMYGSAYKVCKMLKVKNPTDAKIDRKILELKRLYLWSSQLVG